MRAILGMVALALWAGAGAGIATAQTAVHDSALQTFQTGDDLRGWEAVGRLDINGKGFCTGALIAPDLVLTAAHCLFDKATRARIDPSRIEFLPGLRGGRALAYRGVRRAVPDPDYVHTGTVTATNSRHDLAILQLDQPIRSTQIIPFQVASTLTAGTQVGVVSYGRDRADAPSLQQVCSILGEEEGVLVLSCDVDFGSSGAPIFRITDGVAQIVSVVSAKAELNGKRVALGTALDEPLAQIRAEMAAEQGGFRSAPPAQVRVMGPDQRATGGAKFVRP